MAKKVKIVLNREGVQQLLKSEEMKAICQELASGISNRVGPGFEVTTYTGENRVNASVHADTDEALQKCLDDNILIKAIGRR